MAPRHEARRGRTPQQRGRPPRSRARHSAVLHPPLAAAVCCLHAAAAARPWRAHWEPASQWMLFEVRGANDSGGGEVVLHASRAHHHAITPARQRRRRGEPLGAWRAADTRVLEWDDPEGGGTEHLRLFADPHSFHDWLSPQGELSGTHVRERSSFFHANVPLTARSVRVRSTPTGPPDATFPVEPSRRVATLQEDGVEVIQVQVHGRVTDQKNLAILAAGFTAEERELFDAKVSEVSSFLRNGGGGPRDTLNSQPYKRYYHAMNIFAVWQPSPQSGASVPRTGRSVRNNLECTYGRDVERALKCNTALVLQLASHAPAADLMLVLVNDEENYGGTGGQKICAVYTGPKMVGVMLHEFGHADALLADEYDYELTDRRFKAHNCQIGDGASPPEEVQWKKWADATRDRNPAHWSPPWGQQQQPGTHSPWEVIVPRVPSASCSYTNYWKPTSDCMMLTEKDAFCPVCMEAMTREIWAPSYPRVYKNKAYEVDGAPVYNLQQNSIDPGTPFIDLLAPRCPLPGQDVWLTTDPGLPEFHSVVIYNRKGRTQIGVNKDRADALDLSGPFTYSRTVISECEGMTDGQGQPIIVSGTCRNSGDRCGGKLECALNKAPGLEGVFVPQNDLSPVLLEATELGAGRHRVRQVVRDNSRFVLPENRVELFTASEIVIYVVPRADQMPRGCTPGNETGAAGFRKTCHFATDLGGGSVACSNAGGLGYQAPPMCFTCGRQRDGTPWPPYSEPDAIHGNCPDFATMKSGRKLRAPATCDIALSAAPVNVPYTGKGKMKQFEGAMMGIVGVIGFFSLCLFVILIYIMGEYQRVTPQRLTPPSRRIKFMRYFILILAAALMVVGLVGAVVAFWQHSVLTVYGRVIMVVAGVFAVLVCLASYFVFVAAYFRGKGMLAASGVLLAIFCLAFLGMTAFAFWIADNEAEFKEIATEAWEEKVSKDPDEICSFQDVMSCSGFTMSCLTSVGLPPESMPQECPRNCDIHNQNAEPCWDKLRRQVLSNFVAIGTSLVFVVMCTGAGAASAFFLAFDITRAQKAWTEDFKQRARAIGGNDITVEDVHSMKALLKEFERADTDGSGSLTQTEMKHFLESAFGRTMRDEIFADHFKKWDRNGDGVLSTAEFKQVYLSIARAMKTGSAETSDVLSDAERDLLRHEFHKVDTDGSGTLDRDELRQFHRNVFGREMSMQEVNYYFHKLDADGGGTIPFDEFLQVFTVMDPTSGKVSKHQEKALRREFEKIDSNQDGVVDKEELRGFYARTLEGERGELTDAELDYYFSRIDKNNSGLIEFREFLEAMVLSIAEAEMASAPAAPEPPLERRASRARLEDSRQGVVVGTVRRASKVWGAAKTRARSIGSRASFRSHRSQGRRESADPFRQAQQLQGVEVSVDSEPSQGAAPAAQPPPA
eukprot:TRINITY_DN6606_c0_g1_i1.p1 TRINITY_DN6606_c0_g1~~TRINITY_DN6606_c0_g1_i1.p1  ORF type:complete len:1435 (+),score=489.90 TRINITY_DN6606_c0_g1_i1:87-4307(+)